MLLTETIEACLNHATFEAVSTCLKERGWCHIGAGYFSTAYTKGDRVIKVSRKREADWAWVDFMDFVIGNGQEFPLFPKVYGLAVTQHYSIGEMEKLEPIGHSIEDPDGPTGYVIWKGGQPKAEAKWMPFYQMILSDSKHLPVTSIAENLVDTNQQHHALPFWMFRQVCDLNRKRTDFHKGNMMMRWKKDRSGYDLVITDPFCHGNHAELKKKLIKYYKDVECKCNACRMVQRSMEFNPARKKAEPLVKDVHPWPDQFVDVPIGRSFFDRQHAALKHQRLAPPTGVRKALERAKQKACYDMIKMQIGMKQDALLLGMDECHTPPKPSIRTRTRRWWFGMGGRLNGRS